MNERYARLFSLPGDLYAGGFPLLIAAGTLLKDTQTGRLIAQLKLKNLAERPIQSVKVRLFPADPAGRPAGEPLLYSYMDLHAPQGGEFGSKNPIVIPDPTARSFRVELVEVIYDDGSLWEAPEEAVWEPIPAGETIESILGDAELCKQLRLRWGGNCFYAPLRDRDLWRCACGEPVRGETCPACGKPFFSLDLSELTRERDQRLAEEQAERDRQAAEQAELARVRAEKLAEAKKKAAAAGKKVGRIAAIAVPAALLLAAAILLGIPGISTLMAGKAADSGDYLSAIEKYHSAEQWGLFNKLFHPGEKAEALIPASHYQEGEEAEAEGRYLDAIAGFEAAGDYEDASERIISCLPSAVKESLEEGSIQAAADYMAQIPVTGENALLRGELQLYLARAYVDAGETETGMQALRKARFDKNDEALVELANETRYLGASDYLAKGKYSDALTEFGRLSGYRDAKHQTQLCRLGLIQEKVDGGKYENVLQVAKAVEVSQLTRVEKALYQDLMYDTAQHLEAKKDYTSAFELYRLSAKGDYKARMDACNEAYMATPRVLTPKVTSDGSGSLVIQKVSALYHSGTVTFTVDCLAWNEADWGFYAWKKNAESASPKPSGEINKSTLVSFDVPFSLLTDREYEYFEFELWRYVVATDRIFYSYCSFNTSTFTHWNQDLYGNPIP